MGNKCGYLSSTSDCPIFVTSVVGLHMMTETASFGLKVKEHLKLSSENLDLTCEHLHFLLQGKT